jgi:hypothetical protein
MRVSAAASAWPSTTSAAATATASAANTWSWCRTSGSATPTASTLRVEQSGIPDLIPLEMCYLGWQESLAQLATLVEPDIPG